MPQPTLQLPRSQTSPEPQYVPVATSVHAVVLVMGSQLWHPTLLGFVAPGA
jgi:hypothetical protein